MKMQCKIKKILMATLMAGCLVSSALAIPLYVEPVGAPQEQNSWGQLFKAGGRNFGISFDSFEAVSLGGDVFESPGFTDLSDGGWSATWFSASSIRAEGSFMTDLRFRIHFLGDSPTSTVNMEVQFYNSTLGQTPVASVKADWNGATWSLVNNPPGFDPPSAPDGGVTLLLLGMSLSGLAWLRRKAA
jgi:hypothetical protein